ncbi:MAG: hypothetical protein DDT28_01273 [Dehalococcoidia bacterium]|nr:hypothetical protein [Chloroflexota bacterium]
MSGELRRVGNIEIPRRNDSIGIDVGAIFVNPTAQFQSNLLIVIALPQVPTDNDALYLGRSLDDL